MVVSSISLDARDRQIELAVQVKLILIRKNDNAICKATNRNPTGVTEVGVHTFQGSVPVGRCPWIMSFSTEINIHRNSGVAPLHEKPNR
jgi:hypothetical protein